MSIQRLEPGKRLAGAVIHGNTVYLSGQVGQPGNDVQTQARQALAEVDRLLALAGSDKSKILQCIIWLSDMRDFGAMNEVWDEWVDPANVPARATGEARLATAGHLVEFTVTAAI